MITQIESLITFSTLTKKSNKIHICNSYRKEQLLKCVGIRISHNHLELYYSLKITINMYQQFCNQHYLLIPVLNNVTLARTIVDTEIRYTLV